jgi:hypothetical protein
MRPLLLLGITRDPRTGRAAYFPVDSTQSTAPSSTPSAAPLVVPRAPRPSSTLPFVGWCESHAYYLDCMVRFVRSHMEPATTPPLIWNWPSLRHDLARYAYETSSSRFRAFR